MTLLLFAFARAYFSLYYINLGLPFQPILLIYKLTSFDPITTSLWALINNLNITAIALVMLTIGNSFKELYSRYRRTLRTQPTTAVLNRCIAEHERILKAIDKYRQTVGRLYSIHFSLNSTVLMLLVCIEGCVVTRGGFCDRKCLKEEIVLMSPHSKRSSRYRQQREWNCWRWSSSQYRLFTLFPQ